MQSHIDQLFSRLSNSGGGGGGGAEDEKSETLWTKAVTDLVYRMLELQEREQREVRFHIPFSFFKPPQRKP